MLATVRFQGVILVTKLPAPQGTLDKSEFVSFDQASTTYRTMAGGIAYSVQDSAGQGSVAYKPGHGRVVLEALAVFSLAKNEQKQEVVSLVPFPMSHVDCPFADVQVVELHAEYRAHIEAAYRQQTSGIILK